MRTQFSWYYVISIFSTWQWVSNQRKGNIYCASTYPNVWSSELITEFLSNIHQSGIYHQPQRFVNLSNLVVNVSYLFQSSYDLSWYFRITAQLFNGTLTLTWQKKRKHFCIYIYFVCSGFVLSLIAWDRFYSSLVAVSWHWPCPFFQDAFHF